MCDFTVTEIIDGDTFRVPGWEWHGTSGNTIRPTGYNTPEKGEPGYEAAITKLRNLILGKTVQLGKPVTISYGRLVCPVYYNGHNLADHFPGYRC